MLAVVALGPRQNAPKAGWEKNTAFCSFLSRLILLYEFDTPLKPPKNTSVKMTLFFMGNGQKRELQVLFGQKRMYPENNCGRECCWPYLIGRHPLSPVFGHKRLGILPVIATLLSFHPVLAIFCSVFGHFMFLSGGLLDYSNRSTWATRILSSG